MGVTSQILLERKEEGVHRAGDSVTGVVKFAIDKPTEYEDITVSLIGKGYCTWTMNGKSRRRYYGNEKYIDQKIYIIEKPSNVSTVIVPEGYHEHPFEFILPKDIPPSFNDDICEINYKVVLEFVKPRLINSTKMFDAKLIVYGYVKPTLVYPTFFGLEKSIFKPFSMRENKINLKVLLAKTILTPGENIDLSYVLTNQSTVAVNKVRIELVTKTKYTADCGRTKLHEKVLKACTIRQRGCDSDSVDNNIAVVPTLAELYTIQNTKVINKQYFVRTIIVLPLLHINASVEVEVVIGETEPEDNLAPPYSDEGYSKVFEK